MKFLLLIMMVIGIAQASAYTKDENGKLVKIQEAGNNVYIKENGVLRIYESNDSITADNIEESLYATRARMERIEELFKNLTLKLTQAESDKLQIDYRTAKYNLEKYAELLKYRTKMEVGAFVALAGIIINGGVYSAGVVYSAPITGAVVFSAGTIFLTYNTVQYIIAKASLK